MSDPIQEPKELLLQWIEQKVTVDFLLRFSDLTPRGIEGRKAHGKGIIIQFLDDLLMIQVLDGDEITVPINGAFIVEYSSVPDDHSKLIVRSQDHRVYAEFKPHSDVSES
jgi:hypothetical protein